MSHSLLMPKVARMLMRVVPAFVGLATLAGCVEGYPADLAYGVRTDPLVQKEPSETPPLLDRPGQFPLMHFASLNDAHYPLRLGMNQFSAYDPMKLPAGDRAKFSQGLDKLFGKPAEPKVEGIKAETSQELKLDQSTLTQGSILYRRHCLHCHGTTGDGRGPTAAWVNPHPRDYRQGVFKFTSSKESPGKRKPLREDLARTIRQGIESSSMPAFNLLTEDEVQQLVSYVIHLSLRGQTEFATMTEALSDNKPSDFTIDGSLSFWIDTLGDEWKKAPSDQIDPGSYPYEGADAAALKDSVYRGWQSFLNPAGGACIACHLDYGRQGPYRFDQWGTLVHPADLTRGVYRGGRRPIDLFWRIRAGIPPSAMAPFDRDDRQIWDLVNFVLVLPYKDLHKEYGIKID